jgi:hypothetical protein
MTLRPRLLISLVLATLGLGCSTSRHAVRIDQQNEMASSDIALLDGRTSLGLEQDQHTGKADATRYPAGGAEEVPAGPLGAAWVDRGVELASWPGQATTATEVSPSQSAVLSSPNGIAGNLTRRPAVPASPKPSSTMAAAVAAGDGGDGGAAGTRGQGTSLAANAVSGNPAATNIVAGSGRLGELLGINRNGIRFGGLNITDANGYLGQRNIKLVDRDRGEPRGSSPPTPPGIRVRTTAVRSS